MRLSHLMVRGPASIQEAWDSPCLGSSVQATESAQQWEKRAQQLQQKYGKVDLAEHQRVQAELKAAQTELSQIRADGLAQLAEVREELSKVPSWIQTSCIFM